ncbi:hypothetical protein VTJ04DRAFT_8609 [Mycothermus thermophilus]|uniref:uncharacterized protein n=1 Tax=Humicola insolens TaxID=85995 RepID=UPI0037423D4D
MNYRQTRFYGYNTRSEKRKEILLSSIIGSNSGIRAIIVFPSKYSGVSHGCAQPVLYQQSIIHNRRAAPNLPPQNNTRLSKRR